MKKMIEHILRLFLNHLIIVKFRSGTNKIGSQSELNLELKPSFRNGSGSNMVPAQKRRPVCIFFFFIHLFLYLNDYKFNDYASSSLLGFIYTYLNTISHMCNDYAPSLCLCFIYASHMRE